jgi:hypothetical protein
MYSTGRIWTNLILEPNLKGMLSPGPFGVKHRARWGKKTLLLTAIVRRALVHQLLLSSHILRTEDPKSHMVPILQCVTAEK